MRKTVLASVALALLTSNALAQDSKIAVEGNLGGLKFNFRLNNPHNYRVDLQAPGLSVRTVPDSVSPSPLSPPTAAPQPQPAPPIAVLPPPQPQSPEAPPTVGPTQPEPQKPEAQSPAVASPTAEPRELEKKSTSEYFNPGMQSKDAVKPRPYQQQ